MPTKSFFQKFKEYWTSKPNALKLAIVASLLIIGLFAFGVIFQQFKNIGNPPEVSNVTPTPVEMPERPPSAYANDPEVLESERDINDIDQMLQDVDLYETNLLPPKLDMKVEVKLD